MFEALLVSWCSLGDVKSHPLLNRPTCCIDLLLTNHCFPGLLGAVKNPFPL